MKKWDMKKWSKGNCKKNMMAAGVLLVVCAGIYMNWMYSNSQNVADLTDMLDAEMVMSDSSLILDTETNLEGTDTSIDYFAAVRLSRQEARDSAVNLLQEAMAYGSASEQQESNAQLEKIVQTALCEAQIESLIIAKGYTDCVAYMSDTGISVAVASPEGGMQNGDVAVIADIVITQSGFGMEDIRVVEVQ
ncbi:MAG: SpoIIIAH-like family protein [Ruminococcaceae bacterium]|nr:SpoIIIAH-like family protein [Oscillospiraceae bacterium]